MSMTGAKATCSGRPANTDPDHAITSNTQPIFDDPSRLNAHERKIIKPQSPLKGAQHSSRHHALRHGDNHPGDNLAQFQLVTPNPALYSVKHLNTRPEKGDCLLFIPLKDQNPLEHIHFQFVTVGLIILNIAIYILFQSGFVYPVSQASWASFALVPNEFLPEGLIGIPISGETFDALEIPEKYTLITYMFLHGSLLHLGGNMLFLWVFGDNIEDAVGHFKFLIFYLLCGIAGGLTHTFMLPDSTSPLIGASGAISGIIGAYLMLHPRVQLWVLVLGRIPLPVNAALAIIAWLIFQIYQVLYMSETGTAWWAHIGGFVAGIALILIMRRRGVPLFN